MKTKKATKKVRDIFQEAGDALGSAFATYINVFNPEVSCYNIII